MDAWFMLFTYTVFQDGRMIMMVVIAKPVCTKALPCWVLLSGLHKDELTSSHGPM